MAPLPDLSRRGVLGLLGASAVGATALSGCGTEVVCTPATVNDKLVKIAYAHDYPDQYGVLGLPSQTPKGLAILVHGGFWLEQYGESLMNPMAADLRKRGYATWNIEYRRLGNGGGYPATFRDVAAAFAMTDRLSLPSGTRAFSIGHSAGGHLAVWAASRRGATKHAPAHTISLSGVLDLAGAADAGLGGGAVQELIGSRPIDNSGIYPLVDPSQLVPAHGQVIAVHAADDQIVPRNQSASYVRLDRAAGGRARLVTVPGGHFDLIDPTSAAWKQIVTLLPQH